METLLAIFLGFGILYLIFEGLFIPMLLSLLFFFGIFYLIFISILYLFF
jgi:hypothetical protein